jgi:hypothetical protein
VTFQCPMPIASPVWHRNKEMCKSPAVKLSLPLSNQRERKVLKCKHTFRDRPCPLCRVRRLRTRVGRATRPLSNTQSQVVCKCLGRPGTRQTDWPLSSWSDVPIVCARVDCSVTPDVTRSCGVLLKNYEANLRSER